VKAALPVCASEARQCAEAALAVLPVLLVLIFCLINSISRMILQAHGDCAAFVLDDSTSPPAQIAFLRLDMSVECGDAEHASIRTVAWLYFALWPVGCPLLYLLVLLKARASIVRGDATMLAKSTEFLWLEYRPEFLLWEVAEVLRKLALVGFVLLIPAELRMARLLFALLLSIAFVVFTLIASPYRSRLLHFVAVTSQVCLVFVFVGAIVVNICERPDECQWFFGLSSAFNASLVILCLSVGLLVLILSILVWTFILEAKKLSGDGHSHATQLPPELSEFAPLKNEPAILALGPGLLHAEEAVARAPSSVAAHDRLRGRVKELISVMMSLIDAKRGEPNIVPLCDAVIEAGNGFDAVYSSVWLSLIKKVERDGLATYRAAVVALRMKLDPTRSCVQRALTGSDTTLDTADSTELRDPVDLFLEAAKVKAAFRRAAEKLAAATKRADVHLERRGPLKKCTRIVEKALLREDAPGDAGRVCDIVREMFVCDSMRAIAALVDTVRRSPELLLIRIKDRFACPSAGGWRDLMVNVALIDAPHHTCEIQIAHRQMLVARKGLPGHVVYGRVRNARELLESLGLLDPEMRHTRLPKLREQKFTAKRLAMLGCFSAEQLLATGFGEEEVREAVEAVESFGTGPELDLAQVKRDLEHATTIEAAATEDASDAREQYEAAMVELADAMQEKDKATGEVARLRGLRERLSQRASLSERVSRRELSSDAASRDPPEAPAAVAPFSPTASPGRPSRGPAICTRVYPA